MKIGLVLLAVAAVFAATFTARADTEPMDVEIVISPSNVYLESQGVWVTVHAGTAYSSVAGLGVTLDGVPVVFTKADNRGELVAKFNLDDVKAKLEPGNVTLVLSGITCDEVPFAGSDEITVKAGGQGK